MSETDLKLLVRQSQTCYHLYIKRERVFRSLAEQQYDSSFKEFIHEQIAEILAPLLEGVVHSKDIVFEQELTVEVLRPTMRADKVFRARYLGQPHIFHLEYQSGSDAE